MSSVPVQFFVFAGTRFALLRLIQGIQLWGPEGMDLNKML